ncbi:MAG: carboxypeptidase-like regulatory domain-containing protein [Marinoscillum sp.]
MKIKVLLNLLVLSVATNLYGQQTLSGVIKDQVSNKPVPFVNIGVVNRGTGTVSNESGQFEWKLDRDFQNDTIRISSIGYESRSFTVSEFIDAIRKDSVIGLKEQIIELEVIVVSGREFKEKNLGKETSSGMMRGGFRNAELGNEVGTKISVKQSSIMIEKFHTYVTANTNQNLKFRLNFYDLKDGMPNQKLISENIIFPIDIEEGAFTLDLTDYDIVIDEDFVVSVELVEKEGEKEHMVFFSVAPFGNVMTRLTSQAAWEKVGGMGIGFNLTVKYEK